MYFSLDRCQGSVQIIENSLNLMETLAKRLGIILGVSVIGLSIKCGGFCYAIEPAFSQGSNFYLPVSGIQSQERTYPAQSSFSFTTASTMSFDDGVTFSWEEEVQPRDLLEFIGTIPDNQWRQIDERTVRQLFEDIVQRCLDEMDIHGGRFEEVLRQKLFYFIPEFEYYWPPYEKDFSRREVRFPVKIMQKPNSSFSDRIVYFQLGREYDDQRQIEIHLKNTPEGMKIRQIDLLRLRYIPGVKGPPKAEQLVLAFGNRDRGRDRMGDYDISGFGRDWYNGIYKYEDGTWTTTTPYPDVKHNFKPLLLFARGNPEPIKDNTSDEPPLELSGVEMLFDVEPGNTESWMSATYQTFRGLVNLCKLQLGLLDNGYELERVLRKDFLYYTMWRPEDELCNITRLRTDEPEKKAAFELTLGWDYRKIYLTFVKELARPELGYTWGLQMISLVKPVELTDGSVGEEDRTFEFGYVAPGETDLTDMVASYLKTVVNSAGEVLTPKEEIIQMIFGYGNPYPIIYPGYQG